MKTIAVVPSLLAALLLAGCAHQPSTALPAAQLTPATRATRDLARLPPPKGRISVAVYGFRDQTGQYKAAPDSSFSTAVTQGAASMLLAALQSSGWFRPVERENLQDLLTERKIARALETPKEQNAAPPQVPAIPQLVPAAVLVEGGITAYETNVRTGGVAANFLGIGLSTQYRVDQVTVSLRSVDVRSGEVLNAVSTTKTIYSYELHPSVFKFVNLKDLAQFEAGTTRNEPAQLCVREALDAAVAHLIVQGLADGRWELRNDQDWSNPLLQDYLAQAGLAAPGRKVVTNE
jgi:curli production assembly/transport component CsgG